MTGTTSPETAVSSDSPSSPRPQIALGSTLRATRDSGRKLLMPYVTAGIVPDWLDLVEAVVDAGADAVEIGIPFSDPAMDGPTIQQASVRALDNGITPHAALSALRDREIAVPLIAMTYYNLVYRYGTERFASDMAASGLSAAILPDLPIEAAGEWLAAAGEYGIENVLLAAPVTSDERLAMLATNTQGFMYTVSTMGTTGERTDLDDAGTVLARRVKAISDVPVVIGFGISTPEHAVAASRESDGVVVASTLMRTLLDGGSVEEVAGQVRDMRQALDAAY
ncbi:MAG: tryptophan synthase subunit alpha [Ilumatobacter sp.]|uniref:tryptophan synthase subunit alpha n=1 Tax=Ilumatobacter sp. TaxID=1967498 RepID=UPI003298D0DC